MTSRLNHFLAAAVLVAVPAALSAKITRELSKSFAVAPGGTLQVTTQGGDVRVESADVSEVKITARQVVKASTEKEADEKLAKLELRMEQRGNDVVAEAKYPRWSGWGSMPVRVDFLVTVPRQFHAELRTSGGDVAVGSLQGRLAAETSGGDIKAERIDGDVSATTSGGDILLREGTGKVAVETSGGDIRIERAGGPVDAHTSGGDITLHSAAARVNAQTSGGDVSAVLEQVGADCTLGTSGGDVSVQVAKAAAFQLDAETSGGKVDASGLTLTIEGGAVGKHRLAGAVNGGGPRVSLRTSGGDITVRSH